MATRPVSMMMLACVLLGCDGNAPPRDTLLSDLPDVQKQQKKVKGDIVMPWVPQIGQHVTWKEKGVEREVVVTAIGRDQGNLRLEVELHTSSGRKREGMVLPESALLPAIAYYGILGEVWEWPEVNWVKKGDEYEAIVRYGSIVRVVVSPTGLPTIELRRAFMIKDGSQPTSVRHEFVFEPQAGASGKP